MPTLLVLLAVLCLSRPIEGIRWNQPVPLDTSNKQPLGTATCKSYLMTSGQYRFLSNATTRTLAQTNHGDRSRLLAALQRYKDGGNLTIATIGGSITAGQGALDAPNWPEWMESILHVNMEDIRCVGPHGAAACAFPLTMHYSPTQGTPAAPMFFIMQPGAPGPAACFCTP